MGLNSLSIRNFLPLSATLSLALVLAQSANAGTVLPSTGCGLVEGISQATARGNCEYAYNVKAYGAKGNGRTDDTAAIQELIDHLDAYGSPAQSYTIFFPSGTYRITKPLVYYGTPTYHIRFEGAVGGGANATGSAIKWDGDSQEPMFITMGGYGVEFDNLDFNANISARFGVLVTADNTTNTTLGTNVSPGTVTVKPGSMAGIAVGRYLGVGRGRNAEVVYVRATTNTTFTATFTKRHDSTTPVGAGAAGGGGSGFVTFRDVQIYGVPAPAAAGFCHSSPATCTAGVAWGNVTDGDTDQTSELTFYHISVTGAASVADAAIACLNNVGNSKNMAVYYSDISNFHIGVDGGAGTVLIDGAQFAANTVADVWAASGATVTVVGTESEDKPGAQFVVGGSNPSAPSNLNVIGTSWQSAASPSDYVISYGGSMTLIGNSFYNLRAPGSVAKIRIEGSPITSAKSVTTVFSSGNWYENASASDYAPFYDGSNNKLLPSYWKSQPVSITSLNDTGGIEGHVSKLLNYLTAAAITSETARHSARSGVLRCGSGDNCVAFRNSANTVDINGLSIDAGGVVQVGGIAGIRLSTRGPTWTFGSNPPKGPCKTGSLYTRTSDMPGTTLYVCEAGAWKAK